MATTQESRKVTRFGDKLEGRVALVTGGTRGIGAAICRALALQGSNIAAGYSRDSEAAERLRNNLSEANIETSVHQGNIGNPDDCERTIKEVLDQHGRLDILVNNAGIYDFQPLENVTAEHFHKHFDLNVLGLILASQEAVKHFKGGGSIVNISSVASTSAPPTASVYSATKAAVDAVTRSLSKELGPRNIRVNSINPGMVETEGVHAAGITESDFRKQVEAQTPLGRIGQPQDIAPAAVFLASDDARWITGETLYISGGNR